MLKSFCLNSRICEARLISEQITRKLAEANSIPETLADKVRVIKIPRYRNNSFSRFLHICLRHTKSRNILHRESFLYLLLHFLRELSKLSSRELYRVGRNIAKVFPFKNVRFREVKLDCRRW